MRRMFTAVALSLGLLNGAGGAAARPLQLVSNPALPPGYTRLTVHSERVGRDFSITVNTPSAIAFAGQKLPGIIPLDGYGLAGSQGALLSNTSAMEPAIIVSVGYLRAETCSWPVTFLHSKVTTDGPVAYGGGGRTAFKATCSKNWKPLSAKYPADPAKSVLFGHSFGGLFAANVFADKPDAACRTTLSAAPRAGADPGLIARVAAAAPRAHGQHIYLTVGEKEGAGRAHGRQHPDDRRLQRPHEGAEGPARASC